MTLRPVDRSRYSKSTASRLRRYYQADGPCRLLPQSSEPTKLSSRAALLDNFETNGPGTFPAERAAIGDPSHRFGVSELPQHCQQTRSNLAAGAISMHLRRASTTSYEDVPWRGSRDVATCSKHGDWDASDLKSPLQMILRLQFQRDAPQAPTRSAPGGKAEMSPMAKNDTIDPNRTLSCLLCPLICSSSALTW